MICEDDPACRRALVAILNRWGFSGPTTVDSADELLRVAPGQEVGVILIQLALAGLAGLRIIPALAAAAPGSAVVVLSSFSDLRHAAIEAGAYDLVDPRDLRDLERCLDRLTSEAGERLPSPAPGNGAAQPPRRDGARAPVVGDAGSAREAEQERRLSLELIGEVTTVGSGEGSGDGQPKA